eukprot:190529-Chlamydomonas_euryale.AAC.2
MRACAAQRRTRPFKGASGEKRIAASTSAAPTRQGRGGAGEPSEPCQEQRMQRNRSLRCCYVQQASRAVWKETRG